MKSIAKWAQREREILFRNTAEKCGLSEGIVEKDFWVCWILDYLFHDSPWRNHLAFKGGTSLSKCYKGIIKRFSEDVDVILDWRLLGYDCEGPWAERSKTQQAKFTREANTQTEVFLFGKFLPKLNCDFKKMLTEDFSLYIDRSDAQTVCFSYPRLFKENTLIHVVRLEIGVLAAWTPACMLSVKPYTADFYPRLHTTPSTKVLTVSAERTFWEKVTILHKEAFREKGRFPLRYSRHYYDLYCMSSSSIKSHAFADLELLQKVVDFKSRFYASNSARYDVATPRTMRLLPNAKYYLDLRRDYTSMQNMIFGDSPSFESLLDSLRKLEQEINAL